MISYVTVGTNRFEDAVAFWDAIMPDMGAVRAHAVPPLRSARPRTDRPDHGRRDARR